MGMTIIGNEEIHLSYSCWHSICELLNGTGELKGNIKKIIFNIDGTISKRNLKKLRIISAIALKENENIFPKIGFIKEEVIDNNIICLYCGSLVIDDSCENCGATKETKYKWKNSYGFNFDIDTFNYFHNILLKSEKVQIIN